MVCKWLIVLFCFIYAYSVAFHETELKSPYHIEDELEIALIRELEDYLDTRKISDELEQTLQELHLRQLFRRGSDESLEGYLTCKFCIASVAIFLKARRVLGLSKDSIAFILQEICILIEAEHICHGIVVSIIDGLLYIVDNRPDLTATSACSIILQGPECINLDRKDWAIDIPPKTTVEEISDPSNEEPLKVLHLTDVHYDPGYLGGSNGACDEALCCQRGSKPSKPEDAAGYWGDYRNCDTPWHAFVDAMDHIVSQHKNLDYIYFTGDIINHKVWDTNISSNSKAIVEVLHKLKESFVNIPVFPILGNHEPHPVNAFSSEGISNMQLSTQWVFDLVADEWAAWMPEDARTTILRGGYYTVLVKPGFRIIALNSNVCYTWNWWLLYDDVDPFGQLQWLVNILLYSETIGERVHILSHIPSSSCGCLDNWSKEYARIINRFAHIISAQFTGHTHFDETVIYFSLTNRTEAVNVAFNGGSLTSYNNLNYNYKIYDVDTKTLEVLDYESWTYNITEANHKPERMPDWYKLYSFKSAYNVKSLRPHELATLIERMAKYPDLTEKYFRFKHREAHTIMAEGCDRNCEIENLCSMVTSTPGNNWHCNFLTDLYNLYRQ